MGQRFFSRETESAQWQDATPMVEDLETILSGASSHRLSVPEGTWHDQAEERATMLDVDELHDASFRLLEETPTHETLVLIKELRHSKDPQVLHRLKMARKLFMIARDGVLLTESREIGADFDSLFAACRALGRIGDTMGKNSKKLAEESLEELVSQPPSRGLAVDNDELTQRVRAYLHTRTLVGGRPRHSWQLSPDAFHDIRKDFRRVTHLGALAALQSPQRASITFARDGVVLNQAHGQLNDQMYARYINIAHSA